MRNIAILHLQSKTLSDRTRAIMLAHTLGNPFNLKVITDICKKHRLWLIEDCCDALGATYTMPADLSPSPPAGEGRGEGVAHNGSPNKPQLVGTFGDIGTLSFYPAHHITMGEGGAIFTNNPDLFYRRGLIETWGRGTLKIAALMKDAGLAAPTLKVNADFVTMTFLLPDFLVRKARVLAKVPEKSSEKSSEKILNLLQSTPTLSAKALADRLGISSRGVEKQINLLKTTGKLRRIGPAKGGYWEVLE